MSSASVLRSSAAPSTHNRAVHRDDRQPVATTRTAGNCWLSPRRTSTNRTGSCSTSAPTRPSLDDLASRFADKVRETRRGLGPLGVGEHRVSSTRQYRRRGSPSGGRSTLTPGATTCRNAPAGALPLIQADRIPRLSTSRSNSTVTAKVTPVSLSPMAIRRVGTFSTSRTGTCISGTNAFGSYSVVDDRTAGARHRTHRAVGDGGTSGCVGISTSASTAFTRAGCSGKYNWWEWRRGPVSRSVSTPGDLCRGRYDDAMVPSGTAARCAPSPTHPVGYKYRVVTSNPSNGKQSMPPTSPTIAS